ncbi:MAG: DUF5011 domain-containing protein [Acholeplasma sp.]|nr:DUF5011 domain-containing protein [Acholeplasma sp.]
MHAFIMLMTLLSSYRIKWVDTNLKIRLNEDVSEFIMMPQAILFDSEGRTIDDAVYYYERGVNRTSLSVLNSKHVKTYHIDYRVTYYELGISFVQTIIFDIIDDIDPVIISIPIIKKAVGEKLISEKELIEDVVFSDNYYQNSDLTVKVRDLSLVNVKVPGIYKIIYEVQDPSYNVTCMEGLYEIINNNYPEIKYNEPLILEYGKEFNHYNFFKYQDNYDKNLVIEVDDSFVDYSKLGSYTLYVSATNSAHNKTTIQTVINIIDKEKPTLIINDKAMVEVNEYDDTYLSKLILAVSDNYDFITLDDVTIISSVDFNKVGKYAITYLVSDSSKNEKRVDATIAVIDSKKPNITVIAPLEVLVFTSKVNWFDYFDITDNYDNKDDLTVVFSDNKINFNKLSLYNLDITVTDINKNTRKVSYLIEVIDNIAPEVSQTKDIVITDFKGLSDKEYLTFLDIKDNYYDNDDITIKLLDEIDFSKTGINVCTLVISDKSNNESKLLVEIYVVDIYAPTITLTATKYYHYYDTIIDVNEFIGSISDNYDDTKKLSIKISDNIDYSKNGLYKIEVIATDSSNNQSVERVDIYLDIKRPLDVVINDITINKGDNWGKNLGVSYNQNVVKHLTYPLYIDTSKVKEVHVVHVFYDERGNMEEVNQVIKVTEDNKKSVLKNYILIIIINGLGLTVIIISLLRSRNTFDKI